LGASRFGNTLVGWTGGAGAEMFISPRLSVKGEYLYFDLGSAKWNTGWAAVGKATSFPMFTTSESRFDGHVLRFGVNYHFNLFGR
jgi:outer membrane immunogenic protein